MDNPGTKAALHAEIARLKEELASRSSETAGRAAVIAEASAAVISTLDPSEALRLIVTRARTLLNADNACVTVPESTKEQPEYRIVASVGLSPRFMDRVRSSRHGVLATAMRTRTLISTSDLLDDPAFALTPDARTAVKTEGFRSAIGVPLMVGGRLLGALGVGKRQVGGFDPLELETAKIFAAHAAISVQYSIVVDELRTRSDSLAQANAELQAMQEKAVRQERLMAIGQLAATVSHELRNPLGVLRNTVTHIGHLSSRQLPVPEATLQRSIRSIERCDKIIGDLLGFARPRELRRESRDIDEWLMAVLRDYTAPGSIAVRTALQSGVVASFDPDRLEQVVTNVLDNACQALFAPDESNGPTAGTVEIRTERVEDRLEISVINDRHGIPAADHGKVFEPLYSTKSFGVGLGLPLVRQIMRQHDGEVHLIDEPTGGTRVTLSLPYQAPGTSRTPH